MAMAERLSETARTTNSASAAERYGSALREVEARVCELGKAQSGIQHRLSQLTSRLNLLLTFSHHGFVASSGVAAERASDILDLELERFRRMPLSEAVIAMSAVIAATCDALDAEVAAVEATLTSLNAGHGSSIEEEAKN
ncbi:MAG: hypothetical protein HC869_08150 [Rhodospirillales bacterium]|nr:hypothetical protein [Rhodospirillales bacterium]